jgi:hypothetical protein
MTSIVHTIHRSLPKIVEEAKTLSLKRRPPRKRPIKDQVAYDNNVAWNNKLRAENPQRPGQAKLRRLLAFDHGARIMAARGEATRKAREEAEMQAEVTLRQTVAALETTLHNLRSFRAPKTYEKRVNQQQIYNAVRHLKNKCGVTFER